MVCAPLRPCMPWRTRQKSSPSSRFHSSAPFRLGGHMASRAASGPSPLALAPWQRTQCCWYTAWPRTMPCAVKPVGDWCRLVATAGVSSRWRWGQGANTTSAAASHHSGLRPRRHAAEVASASSATPTHSSDNSTRRAWPASTTSISAATRCANGQAGWPCTSGARPTACNSVRRPCWVACRPSSRAASHSGGNDNQAKAAATSWRPAPATPAPRGAGPPAAGRPGGAGMAGR